MQIQLFIGIWIFFLTLSPCSDLDARSLYYTFVVFVVAVVLSGGMGFVENRGFVSNVCEPDEVVGIADFDLHSTT